jgi:hypothetical protein
MGAIMNGSVEAFFAKNPDAVQELALCAIQPPGMALLDSRFQGRYSEERTPQADAPADGRGSVAEASGHPSGYPSGHRGSGR